MAQRVFVMARKQLVAWVTVGGVIAFLAGAIGYGRLTRLARQMVESKVEHISKVAVSNTSSTRSTRPRPTSARAAPTSTSTSAVRCPPSTLRP